MRKLLLLFVFTQLLAVVSAQVSINVNVPVQSGLVTAIKGAGGNLATITNLTVSGIIDARDFKTMRDDMPALTVIDLTNVAIAFYKGDGGTADVESVKNLTEVDAIAGLVDGTPVDYYPAKTIPKNAFANHSPSHDKSRFTAIILPEKATSIGGNAFYRCNSLTSIDIPGSVTSIDNNAFYNCSSLATVILSKKLTRIGDKVFNGCSSLKSITFPGSLCLIGDGAFSGTDIVFTVDKNNRKYSSKKGVLFDKKQTKLLQCPISKIGSYSIPYTVNEVGVGAFKNCKDLTKVTFPRSLTSIDASAFQGCSGLTKLTIPNSVTSIGAYAFSGCSGLPSIAIPLSVRSIDNCAFQGCSSLKQAKLPNSITSISQNLFADCTNLTTVNIPNSVTTIERDAFSGCKSLLSITIPESVKYIGGKAFRYVSNGLMPTNTSNLPPDFGFYAFSGCNATFSVVADNAKYSSVHGVLFDKGQTKLLRCPISTSGSYSIPTKATSIVGGAFKECNNLTAINIHRNIKSIDDGSFYGCSASILVDKGNPKYSSVDGVLFNKNQIKLLHFPTSKTGSYTIPNTVKVIDGFEKCVGLTSVVIPKSVTTIAASCFSHCTGLTSITVYSSIPVELSSADVFYNVNTKTCKLYIPSGSKSLYQAANQWKDFQNIIEVTPN